VGCGSGRPFLNHFGTVTGLEPIEFLAKEASKVYERVITGSLEGFEKSNQDFDCIVSFDVFGHIPNELKPRCFQNMFNALKQGGITIHFIENETQHWFVQQFKEFPEIYKKLFVDDPGHISLEPSSVIVERFKKAGFQVVSAKPIYPCLFPFGCLAFQLLNLPNRSSLVAKFDHFLFRHTILREIMNVLITPLVSLTNLPFHDHLERGLGLIIVAKR
jgi:hypothetical protein